MFLLIGLRIISIWVIEIPPITFSLATSFSIVLTNAFFQVIADHLIQFFLIFNNNLTILGYRYVTVEVAYHPKKSQSPVNCFSVLASSFPHGVTVILPFNSHPSDLFFYSLTGRLIDQISGVTSNAVLWRPKVRTSGCYFVVVKSRSERFVERFVIR